MPHWIPRRHVAHFERAGGTCHATWRLHRDQSALTSTERELVLEVLTRCREFGCQLRAGVVMDDHVHVLYAPGSKRGGQAFVAAWKSTSAHLLTKSTVRTAPIWQAEYFLRWLNGAQAIDRCATYIRNNPTRRWPGIESYPWLL